MADRIVQPNNRIVAITVPPNNTFFGEIVPPYNMLLGKTVPHTFILAYVQDNCDWYSMAVIPGKMVTWFV